MAKGVSKEVSEDRLDIRTFLKSPLKFYSWAGIKLFFWDDEDSWTTGERIILIANIFNLTFNYICKISFSFIREFENEQQQSQLLLYFCFATLSFGKMLSIFVARKRLHKFIKGLDKIFPKSPSEIDDFQLPEHYSYVKTHMDYVTVSHWSVQTMFVSFPIIQSTIEYLFDWNGDGQFVCRFPFILAYPFDETKPFFYFLAYLGQVLSAFAVSIFFLGSDLLLYVSSYLLLIHFDYLNRYISSMKLSKNQDNLQRLKKILEHDSKIHEFAGDVNEVFCISILLNYLISIANLVLLGFQIIIGVDFFALIKFIAFLVACLYQVYYMCLFGSKLSYASEKICEAWSSHAWYDAEIKYQQLIPLAIQRSQSPAKLMAFKFFPLTMESFTTLMTTAYQFFTLIKSQYEEAKT